VAQCVSPEFKPQYYKNKKEGRKERRKEVLERSDTILNIQGSPLPQKCYTMCGLSKPKD
jgi:hypothetical protein